jgi:prolipoprotein diacylglyceryltransferase
VPIAVIAFDFDPLLRLTESLVVRWQTVALAVTIAAGLVSAAIIGRRDGLRADDLVLITIGAVPGAVIGGRIGYVLLHLDYFATAPGAILDPGLGALELALGVVGGLMTGSYVASLLGAPVGRWCHAAVLPLLLVLGTGKLTMVLGGAGQGNASTAPWATAFLGPGPWGSLAPALPSDPSQAYEGIVTLVLVSAMVLVMATGVFEGRDGRALLVGLASWAFARAAVALTWRGDQVVLGLGMGSLIAIGVGIGCLAAVLVLARRSRDLPPAAPATVPVTTGPSWPDPESRPRF